MNESKEIYTSDKPAFVGRIPQRQDIMCGPFSKRLRGWFLIGKNNDLTTRGMIKLPFRVRGNRILDGQKRVLAICNDPEFGNELAKFVVQTLNLRMKKINNE